MKITEIIGFNEYWERAEFQCKKPNLNASKKLAFGDNIYHWIRGKWKQLDSHHSLSNGKPNVANVENDTQTDRILMGKDFVYYGGAGPTIPRRFRNYDGVDVCAGRGYRVNFPSGFIKDFIEWIAKVDGDGFVGEPSDWSKSA